MNLNTYILSDVVMPEYTESTPYYLESTPYPETTPPKAPETMPLETTTVPETTAETAVNLDQYAAPVAIAGGVFFVIVIAFVLLFIQINKKIM